MLNAWNSRKVGARQPLKETMENDQQQTEKTHAWQTAIKVAYFVTQRHGIYPNTSDGNSPEKSHAYDVVESTEEVLKRTGRLPETRINY
jgi:hypothetical protein